MNASLAAMLDVISEEENFSGSENLPKQVPYVPNVPTLDFSLSVDPLPEFKAEDSEILAVARDVVDAALEICKENPGILASETFIESLKIINQHPGLKFEYRVKIKQVKPSGVLLSEIDDAVSSPSEDGGSDSISAELIALVLDKGELFFDTQSDKGFASIDMEGVIHTLQIGSKPFVEWLSYSFYQSTKTGDNKGKSASEAAIKQSCFALAGIAKHEGQHQSVYMRVADHNGGHYIFIGDEQLRVIEVLPTGWRILNDSPVKFWRPSSMQSLPIPQAGGNLSLLWQFVNIPEDDRPMVLAWMLEALRSETPKPILALSGTQGSDSVAILRQLVLGIQAQASSKNYATN